MNPEMLFHFIIALAGIVMILAAASDAARYRIPNAACAALLLLFPLYIYAAPITIHWEKNLMVFAVTLVLGYLLFLKNWVGAGDIKFLSVTSLWAGPSFIALLLTITAISGGLLALSLAGLAFVRHRLSHDETPKPNLSQIPVPYGIAIALGGLCTLALLLNPALLQAKG
ncbi:MAG: prepilin peptidase [Bdellovibrionales bacterium]|jgi:prepilin peptidase CpaA